MPLTLNAFKENTDLLNINYLFMISIHFAKIQCKRVRVSLTIRSIALLTGSSVQYYCIYCNIGLVTERGAL